MTGGNSNNTTRFGSAESVDNETALLPDGTIIEKNTYIGTRLMKNAGLVFRNLSVVVERTDPNYSKTSKILTGKNLNPTDE